jgi:hypothetical protein
MAMKAALTNLLQHRLRDSPILSHSIVVEIHHQLLKLKRYHLDVIILYSSRWRLTWRSEAMAHRLFAKNFLDVEAESFDMGVSPVSHNFGVNEHWNNWQIASEKGSRTRTLMSTIAARRRCTYLLSRFLTVQFLSRRWMFLEFLAIYFEITWRLFCGVGT